MADRPQTDARQRAKRRLWDLPARQLRAELRAERDTTLAVRYGVARMTIWRLRRLWGIPPHPVGQPRRQPSRPDEQTVTATPSFRTLMSAETSIEWTDRTWNVVRGCSRVSTGCEHCYAETQAGRFSGPGQPYEGLVRKTSQGWKWTGAVRFIAKDLAVPLRWQAPQRIFVNSMSDLFHDEVEYRWILALLTVCAFTPQHTYQILTKRPQRMYDVMTDLYQPTRPRRYFDLATVEAAYPQMNLPDRWRDHDPIPMETVLPHVWLGVSVENHATAAERIPWLLKTPAAVRFLSAEPLLEALDLTPYLAEGLPDTRAGQGMPGELRARPGVDMVIAGGESGPHARGCDLAWLRSLKDQCAAAQVPCFIKQLGAKAYQSPQHDGGTGFFLPLKDRKGGNMDEFPPDLRVRQMPEVRYA